MRDLQGEVARLQAMAVEHRDAVGAAEQRSGAEAGFRARAEQGWERAAREVEQAEQQARQEQQRTAEAEGRLHAAQAQAALVPGLEERARGLEEKLRGEAARSQSSQHSEMQSAQLAAQSVQRAQQEGREAAHRAEEQCQHHLDAVTAEGKHWRKQAEGATGAARQAAVSLGQSRGVVEAMLARLQP